MATTNKSQVIRMTANNDTYVSAFGKLRIKGIRLVAGVDAATALIKQTDTNGAVLCSLKAAANSADTCNIPFICDAGTIFVGMTGTSPEVYIYLE